MVSLIVAALGIILVFFLCVMVYDCNRFVVTAYEIRSKKIVKESTWVMLSDLHGKSYGKNNEILLHKIDEITPDGILAAGDMITASRSSCYKKAAALLEELAKKYPLYYGLGNHEVHMKEEPEEFGDIYGDYENRLKEAGIEPLVNEAAFLPTDNIRILGLDIGKSCYRKFRKFPIERAYLVSLLGTPREDMFQILIAHNPDYFEEYEEWGVDLVVSGHVHGGLMRLPYLGGVVSPKLTLFPKYDSGVYTRGNCNMIVGRGLGTHTLPIRIFNPGELVVIHLKPDRQS